MEEVTRGLAGQRHRTDNCAIRYNVSDRCAATGQRPSTDPQITSPADVIYRAGAAGVQCWSRNTLGKIQMLPMSRWMGGPTASEADRRFDDRVMNSCRTGPVLDVGCGPGRMTASLSQRGCASLGIDVSQAAIEITRQRGGAAMRRDVFDRLPGEGYWQHVLLADGNIGIGGDPRRILARAGGLIHRGGTVIVEVDEDPNVVSHEVLRWETTGHVGQWFSWSRVGISALSGLAGTVGLVVHEVVATEARTVAVLSHVSA
ncbi:MAG: methyltransferase domain-containing protein [Mycobacterium sp.]